MQRPRPGSPRRGHQPSASTGSLIDPYHPHPYPPRDYNPYATGPASPRSSNDSLPYLPHQQPHGPPPPQMPPYPHPGYAQPPLPHQLPLPHQPPPPPQTGPSRSLRGQPHGMDPRMMDPAEFLEMRERDMRERDMRERDMRERREIPRDMMGGPPQSREPPVVNQPPGPGVTRRNTVNGHPRPILRHSTGPAPHAPPPPGDYEPHPSNYHRAPPIVHRHSGPPGTFPRDHSPDGYGEYHPPGQYMVTPGLGPQQPNRGGPHPDGPHYPYVPPEHLNSYVRGGPPLRDMPPYDRGMPPPPFNDGYIPHRPPMPRTRSPSRPGRRSMSAGRRSDSRPGVREAWDDYGDYRDDYYSGSAGRTSSRNGSDEMSGGSGPHPRALTRTRSVSQSGAGGVARRPDAAAAEGPPGAPGAPGAPGGGSGIRVDLGGAGALDISYSGTGGGRPIGHIIINQHPRGNRPRDGETITGGNSNALVPLTDASGNPSSASISAPVPPPSNQTTLLPQPPAPPPPQFTSQPPAPSAPNILNVGVPGEFPAGIIHDADAERDKMAMEQQQLTQGVNALALNDYNYPPQNDGDRRVGGLRKLDDDLRSSALVPRDPDRYYERDDDRGRDQDRYWNMAGDRRDRGRSREDRWRDSDRSHDWEGDREREREREKIRRHASSSRPPRKRSASAGPRRRDGPRWTKISREIVSPRAVQEMGWDFDADQDSVTVYRVLSKDEIDEIVALTASIRRKDKREREHRRGHTHSHSHSHPRRERGDRAGGFPPPPPPQQSLFPHGVPFPGSAPPMAPGPPRPARSPAENALAYAPPPPPPPPPAPDASLVPPGPAPPPAPSPAPTPGPPAQAAAPPPPGPPAPSMRGPIKRGGLMENPAEPGTYLQYRRNPPQPQSFYRRDVNNR